MDDALRKQVVYAVTNALRSFEDAERARDAEAVIAHFARVPEFHIYNDGERVTYDALVALLRGTLPALQSLEGGFVDVDVIALAPDAALTTGTFQEATTNASGQTTRMRGAATWLWKLIAGRWLIVYGQADHRDE